MRNCRMRVWGLGRPSGQLFDLPIPLGTKDHVCADTAVRSLTLTSDGVMTDTFVTMSPALCAQVDICQRLPHVVRRPLHLDSPLDHHCGSVGYAEGSFGELFDQQDGESIRSELANQIVELAYDQGGKPHRDLV